MGRGRDSRLEDFVELANKALNERSERLNCRTSVSKNVTLSGLSEGDRSRV